VKKIVLCVIAVMLILCGCKQQAGKPAVPTASQAPSQTTSSTQPSETTAPTISSTPTQPTRPTETTAATAPTEMPTQELEVEDWQLDVPNYLSYEDYFATEREFLNTELFNSQTSWTKGSRVYEFGYENGLLNRQKDDEILVVYCEEIDEKYVVPGSKTYINYTIAGADGHYGYLYNENSFLRMDLATGNVEKMLEGYSFCRSSDYEPINVYLLDNLVAYYISYADGELSVGRLYLPAMKNEILHNTQGEFYNISLQRPKTNQSPVVWTMTNPEFVDYLKAELANPNSKIQKGTQYDYSQRWKEDDAFSTIINSPMHLHYLQDAGNQRALLKWTLDLGSEELTKQTGLIDSCFHGSGYPHDHYNTDVTTAPAPELIMGDWTKISQQVPFPLHPSTDGVIVKGKLLKVTDVESQVHLYAKTDGDYQKVSNDPIRMVVDTGSCAIYVTADGKAVIAVSYDGTQSVELYRASYGGVDYIRFDETELHIPSVRSVAVERRFVIRDGDTLVEVNLDNLQYRPLVKHPNLQNYHIDAGFGDAVYFEVYVGLYSNGYVIDLQTGKMREVGYQL